MARFNKIDSSRYSLLRGCECYVVNGTLTLDDASKLNRIDRQIVLIFENTKGQNSGVIGALDPHHIKISVTGGLDYLHKNKYNDYEYMERTFYTPKNLSSIIKTYESIERKIPYSWTEAQKCMYVYKTLVEKMHYILNSESEYENGVDVSRTLNGLLARRAVCSGFALIFKEAMDRLGIECYYQNKAHHHSWNAVKLDGQMYLLDLTWDVVNKTQNQQCSFGYFCRQDSSMFYSNKHHDFGSDREEIRFAAKEMDFEDLKINFNKVNSVDAIYSRELQHYENEKGQEFDYLSIGETQGLRTFIIRKGESLDYYYIDKDGDIRRTLDDDILKSARDGYGHNISRTPLPKEVKTFRKYQRRDGSEFLLHKTSAELKGGISEYILIEPTYRDGKKVLKRSRILSENDLINVNDRKYEEMVANGLLSQERLDRKVKYYNGYVGYVSNRFEIIYDRNFETQELGIQQRM
jgi:hypothetical protein